MTTDGKSFSWLIPIMRETLVIWEILFVPFIAVSDIAELDVDDVNGFGGGDDEEVHGLGTNKLWLEDFEFDGDFK